MKILLLVTKCYGFKGLGYHHGVHTFSLLDHSKKGGATPANGVRIIQYIHLFCT